MMVQIEAFAIEDQAQTVDVILSIQQQEFEIPLTAEDQPDLGSIPNFYQSGLGGFWVAKLQGAIVGTIGLKDIGNGNAALRKMFVSKDYRGKEFGVAHKLLSRLMDEATKSGIDRIYLGTTDKFVAAHRFYEKNGFTQITRDALSNGFPLMAVDTVFYARELD